MLQETKTLLGLIRFSHTVFALPFALLAALLAWRETAFRIQDLAGILLCMVFARSAAMAFNRIVDRKIDAENPRTAGRHLPAGLISLKAVVFFTVLCSVGFVCSTLLFLPNFWPLYLSGPVLAFLCGYSYTKRFTWLCHYWLSAALMLSPLATWIAITGTLSWIPALLAGTIFFWVGGFDIIYACQDASFDQEKNLRSIPARFGIRGALKLALLSHICTAACLVGLWWVGNFGFVFLAGVIAVILLLAYEHFLVSPENLSKVNMAFFHVNSVISLGLLVVGAIDLWAFRTV